MSHKHCTPSHTPASLPPPDCNHDPCGVAPLCNKGLVSVLCDGRHRLRSVGREENRHRLRSVGRKESSPLLWDMKEVSLSLAVPAAHYWPRAMSLV